MAERKWKEFVMGPARKGGLHVTICRKGNIMIGAAAFRRRGGSLLALEVCRVRNGTFDWAE